MRKKIIITKASVTAALNAIVDNIIPDTDGNTFCVNLYVIGNGGYVTNNACCWSMTQQDEDAFMSAAASYIQNGDVTIYDASQKSFVEILAENNLKIKDHIK